MEFRRPTWILLLALPAIFTSAACGNNFNANGFQSGNWQFVATGTSGSNQTFFAVGGAVTSSQESVSGVTHVTGFTTCFDPSANAPLSGSGSFAAANLKVSANGSQTISLSYTGSGTVGAGTFTVDGGCDGGDHGNFTATRIPSLTANWTGSLTPAGGGTARTFSVNLSQDPTADADGFFHLSGTASSDGVCFSSAGVNSGAISGAFGYAQLDANSSLGLTLQLSYTGANKLSGAYAIASGVCAGESGTFTLSH
jgi:hypothetical protein